jgi:hypothetical protein
MKNPKKLLKILVNFVSFAIISGDVYGWDGYDIDSNSSIEITDNNLVREGQVIKIFDWKDNTNHLVNILSMDSDFNNVVIKVEDNETKEIRTFRMDNKH